MYPALRGVALTTPTRVSPMPRLSAQMGAFQPVSSTVAAAPNVQMNEMRGADHELVVMHRRARRRRQPRGVPVQRDGETGRKRCAKEVWGYRTRAMPAQLSTLCYPLDSCADPAFSRPCRPASAVPNTTMGNLLKALNDKNGKKAGDAFFVDFEGKFIFPTCHA